MNYGFHDTISQWHVEVEFRPSPSINIEITCTNRFTVPSKIVNCTDFHEARASGTTFKKILYRISCKYDKGLVSDIGNRRT